MRLSWVVACVALTMVGCSGNIEEGSELDPASASSGVESADAVDGSSDGARGDAAADGGQADGAHHDAGADGEAGACDKTVYADVQPVFQKFCATCHRGASDAWGSNCTVTSAASARIAALVSSGAMPRNATLPAADKALILKWVTDGALCTGSGC